MRQTLTRHPDSACPAVSSIGVRLTCLRPGALELLYSVTGAMNELRLPPVADSARTDNLWRHTCFEAFLHPGPGAAYYEFNLAPSTQWAAYGFTGYRGGMRPVQEIPAPRIEVHATPDQFDLLAILDLTQLPGQNGLAHWRLGLSSVIEDAGGRMSYWALAHSPGKPDFHHSDGFVLELPAAWRP